MVVDSFGALQAISHKYAIHPLLAPGWWQAHEGAPLVFSRARGSFRARPNKMADFFRCHKLRSQ